MTGVTLTVHLPDRLAQDLDAWIANQPAPRPTREEAVQAMVEAALKLAEEVPPAADPWLSP